MQENVKPAEPEPIIRFVDVCKTFRYHGARLGDDADEEEAEDSDAKEEDEGKEPLKPGETRTALNNINLSIMPGERVGVVGINGSGKSTLLKIVAGMSHPTSGRVVGRGSLIPLSQILRPLNETWDGRGNLRVLARLLGFPTGLVDECSDKIASFAGMEDAISQPVSTYSRAMYARLAFAAALELNADIYIADDTLGVGDQAYQAKCFNRLVELCRSGKTLLFATHKLKLIEQLCTRAIWLDKGEVRADNHPAVIVANYQASMVEELADAEEGAGEGDANSVATWFKAKYGFPYPFPPSVMEPTRPLPNAEGELQDHEGGPEIGGIVGLELSSQSELEGVVKDNATFSITVRVDVLAPNTTVDVLLEIIKGKVIVYQSLLPEPVFVRVPREIVFEIAMDSNRLPDQVYRVRVSALLAPDGNERRYISSGQLYVATNNCGPALDSRVRAFGSSWRSTSAPLSTLDLDWRLVESHERATECNKETVPALEAS